MVKLYSMSVKNPKKFLNKFFDTLKPEDFTNVYHEHDNPNGKATVVLKNFYDTYLTERTKYESHKLPLFEFYLEYLTRSMEADPDIKEARKLSICEEIVDRIFSPDKYLMSSSKLIDDNVPQDTTNPASIRDSTKSTNGKIVVNKKICLKILSNMLENAVITLFEEPDRDDESSSIMEQFKESRLDAIKKDIEKDVKQGLRVTGYIEGPKDAGFQKIENSLLIWKDTADKCIRFLNQNSKFSMWLDTLVIDARQINLFSNDSIQTVDNDGRDDQQSQFLKVLPVRTLRPMWSKNRYQMVVHLKNEDYLTNAIDLAHKKEDFMLVLSGNRMIPGGGSDQGIVTNETPLYYASSYHMSINNASSLYPLSNEHLIYTPSVFVFKDHNDGYKILKPHQGARISVLTAPSPYRPDTNIPDITRYEMDARLWDVSTQYKYPSKLEQQTRDIFNTCLFFGKDTIIISDRGIEDFWLPVYHTAEIMVKVLNEYHDRLKAVYICVTNPKIYKIFSKLIYKK